MKVKDISREDDGDIQELVVTLVASAEEVDDAAEKFFADVAKRDIKGFRKGKAPREVLEREVGGHSSAMGGIAESLVNELGISAIDEEGIIFLEEPTFNVEELPEEGQAFTFTISGAVQPKMTLSSIDPVEVEMPPEEVTDEEIEDYIRNVQDYYHSFETITDENHKAELGDFIEAKLTVTNKENDRPVSGLHGASRMIGLGDGTMPDSFDEQVLGAKIGDKLEFDFEAINEDGKSDFGDGKLHAFVEIEGMRRRVLPEIDDDLAAKVGAVDVADMYKQVKYNIGKQKHEQYPKLLIDRAIEQVAERLEAPVPTYYVDYIRQDVGREMMKRMEDQGTTLQQWMLQNAVQGEEFKENIEKESVRRATVDCALEALFAGLGLEVTEEDVDEFFAEEENPEHTRKEWENANRMADIVKMLRRQKATRWLVDNAKVTTEGK